MECPSDVLTEQKLSEPLSRFARTMLTDFPVQAILDRLVQCIVDVMPITAAGVTLIDPGLRPRHPRGLGRFGLAIRAAADRPRREALPGRL